MFRRVAQLHTILFNWYLFVSCIFYYYFLNFQDPIIVKPTPSVPVVQETRLCWWKKPDTEGWSWEPVWQLIWGSWAATRRYHYNDVIMSAMASQITGVSIACLTVCSGADQRKHQSSASLAFVRGIHQWPVNSPHKGPVTRKMFPFDDVIMTKYPIKCVPLKA